MSLNCLVVDDMGPMRRTVSLVLKGMGFDNISEAKNGKEAFDKIMANFDIPGRKIEIAIVDWNMAPLTGLDLLKMVRQDKRVRDIIFIMITAEQMQENVIAAVQSGVDEYIIKPFTPQTVKQKFINITKRKVAEIKKELDEVFEASISDLEKTGAADKRDRVVNSSRSRMMKLFAISPFFYLVPLELGRMYLRLNDLAEAERWLRKAVGIDFGASEAHHLLSQILRKQGRIPESIRELEIAVVERPKSGDLKQKLGEAYMRAGRTAEAIGLLGESIQLFDAKQSMQKARSKNSMGKAKLTRGEEEGDNALKAEAVADIKDAARLDPGLIAAHYNLALAFKAVGKNKEAQQALDNVQAMEPRDAEGWVAVGNAFLAQSENGKAKFAFNKAAELAANDFSVYEDIASALYNHKLHDDAIGYLNKAEEINPSDVFIYNLRGLIHRLRDNHKEAIKEYERAVKLEPENAGLHFNLGVAHFKADKKNDCKEHFLKAKELDSQFTQADEYLKLLN